MCVYSESVVVYLQYFVTILTVQLQETLAKILDKRVGIQWQCPAGLLTQGSGIRQQQGLRVLQSQKFHKIHAYRTDCRIFKRIFKTPDWEILEKSSKNPGAEQGLYVVYAIVTRGLLAPPGVYPFQNDWPGHLSRAGHCRNSVVRVMANAYESNTRRHGSKACYELFNPVEWITRDDRTFRLQGCR